MTGAVRTTWILLAALVAAIAVDLWAHSGNLFPAEELPSLARIELSAVTRVVLTHGDDQVIFEPDGKDGFDMVAPKPFHADRASVMNMLTPFYRDVRMDARVDSDDYEAYGLAGAEPVFVEVLGAQGRLSAFFVGHDSGMGATFVRFPDDDDVYRARIGGRHRYDKPVGAWRDHMVFGVHPDLVVGVEVAAPLDLAFRRPQEGQDDRGAPILGDWVGYGPQGAFAVDQDSVTGLARTLATTRAGTILSPSHPAGLDDPIARVTVTTANAERIPVTFGRTADGTYARIDGRDEVYQVSANPADMVRRPPAFWRDRSLLQLDRADIHRVSLHEGQFGTAILEQDPTNSSWTMIQPENVDVTLRTAMAMARAVAKLSVDQIVEVPADEAGFGDVWLEVTMKSGDQYRVEVGRPVAGLPKGREALFVRRADQPKRIGVLSARAWIQIRQAFSR